MLRIVHVTPKEIWDRRVSPSRRHEVLAVQRHPGVRLVVSGQGWPDWDESLPAAENVERLLPGTQAVWLYKAEGRSIHGRRIRPVKGLRALADHYLVVEKWQEAAELSPPAWRQAIARRVGLCLLAHANDAPLFARAVEAGARVEVARHCAEAAVFGEAWRPWAERDVSVCLTGTISSPVYPLRARWRALLANISSATGWPARFMPRPPLFAASADEATRHVRAYAELLGRSKIVLGCSSRHRYALARFPEAAACGAVHVADAPDDAAFMADFGRAMVVVDPAVSDEALVHANVQALADDDALRRKAELSRHVWRNSYTQEHWAARFVRLVAEAAKLPSCL